MSEAAPSVIIDFPDAPRRAFFNPSTIIRTRELAEVRSVISQASRLAEQGLYVAGFVSYEAAPAFDTAFEVLPGAQLPLVWFAAFERAQPWPSQPAVRPQVVAWQLTTDANAYQTGVAKIREEIAAGRTYQVNLTARLVAAFETDPLAFYEALRRAQGNGYHAYVEAGDFVIMSASPELFFELQPGRIRTRPMKGTRPRGRWLAEDDALAAELLASEKDRAENLMIVDLLRNDVGRIAQLGSVTVTSLYDVEHYRTVHQLTSTVEASLASNITLGDVFAALFPCGSVTGAPKVSTMRIITELETDTREVYCGAVGLIEPNGSATFNVAIRTVWLEQAAKRAVYGTGAGITYDSDPAAEYREVVSKAALLVEAWPQFELLETMRSQRGVIVRLERHLSRLLGSARYFGIPVDEASVRHELARVSNADVVGMVRLLVSESGQPRIEVHSLDNVSEPLVALARSPVSSSDRFLFHKTTHRQVYEQHRQEADGYWDVLLWNERGELTEFTRGNLVVDLDGALLTPAQHCGLLAGTFRAELLDGGYIREAVVHRKELARVARVWLVNSLREWVPVRLEEESL